MKVAQVNIRAASEADLPAIRDIYNDAVSNTTAIWNDTQADLADRRLWYRARRTRNFPVLVATQHDKVVAYASYGDFRAFTGYRFTVEHSIYVHADHRGQGVAKTLLPTLIEHARIAGLHAMVAGIEAQNAASIALHANFGFIEVGRLPEVGYKFGRYLDLVFMQLLLQTDPVHYAEP